MAVKFTNNAVTTLTAGISGGVTQFAVASATGFPTLGGSDWTYVTIDSEVVKVTAIVGTTFTCVATSDAHLNGDNVELRMTAELLNDFAEDLEALPRAGGTMTGAIAMGTNKITGVGDPTAAQDVVSKTYSDLKLAKAGGEMSGNITMAGSQTVDGRDISADGTQLDTNTSAIATKSPIASPTFTGTVAIPNIANLETAVAANTAKTGITGGQASAITANTAKVTNATHTGEVTGSGALTIANDAVTTVKILDDNVTVAKLANAINTDIATGVTANTTANAALPKTGGAMTGNVTHADNVISKWGTGNDLEIYHDASHSYIKDAGTGHLKVQVSTLTMESPDAGETIATFHDDGAVNLYYNDSKKFETTNTGTTVTGNIAVSGTVDGIDIAARDGVLTSTTTTAGAALPKAGGTMTGDLNLTGDSYNIAWDKSENAIKFNDNAKIKIGTGGDLQIYHDGGNSIIKEDGTGDLLIYAADQVKFLNNAGSEYYLVLNEDGATQLYYNGSEKLATDASGATVTGNITVSGTVDAVDIASRDAVLTSTTTTANAALPKAGGTMTGNIVSGDNVKATYGASADLQIYHDGADSFIKSTNGPLMLQNTNSNIVLQAKSGEAAVICIPDGEVELRHNNSTKFATTSGGVSVTGNVATTGSVTKSSGNLAINPASGQTLLYKDGNLKLETTSAGVTLTGAAVGTMTTDNDGSFSMTASNNFKCTPSGNFTLTFTNIAAQSGNILLVNSGGHTVSAHANTKVDANILATISAAGTYLLAYFSDGTNAYMTNSAVYT